MQMSSVSPASRNAAVRVCQPAIRSSPPDLQRNGEVQQGQRERYAVLLHVSQRARNPDHLHDARQYEVQTEQHAADHIHGQAQTVEQGVQRALHVGSFKDWRSGR